MHPSHVYKSCGLFLMTRHLTCRDAGWLDAGILEVPQNSDATIRLLKARIKSLEEQLGTSLKMNQGEGLCRPSVFLGLPVCQVTAGRSGAAMSGQLAPHPHLLLRQASRQ
jgi:hypothetical protein